MPHHNKYRELTDEAIERDFRKIERIFEDAMNKCNPLLPGRKRIRYSEGSWERVKPEEQEDGKT